MTHVSEAPAPSIATVVHQVYESIVVPVDGSARAERAIDVAARLGAVLGADLRFVCSLQPGDSDDEVRAYLNDVHERVPGPLGADVVEWDADPTRVIRRTADSIGRPIICMATHGRGWVGTTLLGSVATAVLAASRHPVVMVGPEARPAPAGAPVVACVDGSAVSELTVPLAITWASLLGTSVDVVTVAEPVLESLEPGASRYRRSFGPPVDAGAYAAEVASRFSGVDVEVGHHAIYDPLSVSDGLACYLEERPAELVVVTSHASVDALHPFVGRTAASIVRHSPAPVLFHTPRPRG